MLYIDSRSFQLVLLVAALAPFYSTQAVEIYDDFDDNNHQDGTPVSWLGANATVTDGDLHLSGEHSFISPTNEKSETWSIRSAVSFTSASQSTGFLVNNNFWGILWGDGSLQIGEGQTILNRSKTEFDPRSVDTFLQFDTFDGKLRAWAWPTHEPKPLLALEAPYNNPFAGNTTLWTLSEGTFLDARASSTRSVPEPSAGLMVAVVVFALLAFRGRNES